MKWLQTRAEKFIVYCDDLSFEDGEPGYKALKSILDGTVAASTANVLVYATSNRRHLLPEYMKENLTYTHTDDGEVHPGEGVEEKISLSERFGLWVSFYPFSQDEYLAITAQWLSSFGVSYDGDRCRQARGFGLGAGARFAQWPCGLPVCPRLCRQACGDALVVIGIRAVSSTEPAINEPITVRVVDAQVPRSADRAVSASRGRGVDSQ